MANLHLDYRGYEQHLMESFRDDVQGFAGIHYIFGFENGLGASVIKTKFSKGFEKDLWELAVIKLGEKDYFGFEFDIVYGTSITQDIEGYLTDEEVRNLLGRIKEL